MTDVTNSTSKSVDDRRKKQDLLRSLLEFPGESPQTDYKSSEAFDGKSDFSLKLIRHILGMANAGGGYLVIGFPEGPDSKPQKDPNISDEIIATYEATSLPQMLVKKIRGTNKLDLVVHHVDFESKRYPVLEIGEFSISPFFCNSEHRDANGKLILRQGALYIRTANSNTEEISNPEEWEKLMRIAMRKRNDELLERFSKLLEQAQKGTAPVEETKKKELVKSPTWFAEQRTIAEKAMTEAGFNKHYFEVTSYLPGNQAKWNQAQLLGAMTKAVLRNTGWPQGVVLHVDDHKPRAVKDGIQATIVAKRSFVSFDHWGLSQKGDYYFCRTYHEDFLENKEVATLGFDTRIWRIAEAIDHTFSLYSQLEVDSQEPVIIEITHKGLKGRYLTANDPRRLMWENRSSAVDVATWKTTTTLDGLKVNRRTFIHEAIKELTVYFDFFELQPNVIDGVIEEYDKSRL